MADGNQNEAPSTPVPSTPVPSTPVPSTPADNPRDASGLCVRNRLGRFAPGNQSWRRTNRPFFRTPEELWSKCVEYFKWVEENPLYQHKLIAYQGEVTDAYEVKPRAMTKTGLSLHLGVSLQVWEDWKRLRDDLLPVIQCVEAAIYAQKFEGAAVDMFNASIITRDLGLADEQRVSGAGGGPMQFQNVGERELARRLAFVLARGAQGDDPQAQAVDPPYDADGPQNLPLETPGHTPDDLDD